LLLQAAQAASNQCSSKPLIALSNLAAFVLPCTLVVSRAQPSPRSQVSIRGKSPHIQSDLGDDDLGRLLVNSGDRTQQFNGLGERDSPFDYLLGYLLNGFVKEVQMAEDLPEHKPVMISEAAFQCLLQFGQFLSQPPTGEVGQYLWIGSTSSEQSLHHSPTGDSHHISGHGCKLDIGGLQSGRRAYRA